MKSAPMQKLPQSVTAGRPVLIAGHRWNGFEYVNWRKEKKRKRKLQKLNMKQMRKSLDAMRGHKVFIPRLQEIGRAHRVVSEVLLIIDFASGSYVQQFGRAKRND